MRLLVVALCAVAGCATMSAGGVARHDPGRLESPARYPGAFMMRQRVEVIVRDRTLRFEAVLQKQGETLTLVGLTPFGSRAFVIEQRGTSVTFVPTVPMELPFPPSRMMLDIQRVFLRALDAGATVDGERAGVVVDEPVRETWRGGRLMRREYVSSPGGAVADYEGGMTGRAAPRVVRYQNRWSGYSLVITTLTQQALPE